MIITNLRQRLDETYLSIKEELIFDNGGVLKIRSTMRLYTSLWKSMTGGDAGNCCMHSIEFLELCAHNTVIEIRGDLTFVALVNEFDSRDQSFTLKNYNRLISLMYPYPCLRIMYIRSEREIIVL